MSAFPYVGGKTRYADWIIGHFPAHRCYVEPFGGAAAVLLNKQPSPVEIYNDLNRDVVHFFQVARERRDELEEWLSYVPHARDVHEEWARAFYDGERPEDDIERAGRWFYLRYTQFGAKLNGYSGYKNSTKRNVARTFHNNAQALEEIAARFRGVQLECRDWKDVVRRNDGSDTLVYLDPPYVDCEQYYNVDNFDHAEFEAVLRELEADWVVSYSDPPEAFTAVDAYTYASLDTTYSLDVTEGEQRDEATERLVMNFDPAEREEFRGPQTTLDVATDGSGGDGR
ncbi:DNA adenine methylase [Halorussus halobius]|uniref:DNA adenine methylase n=1 Tax=Halorussus halobius TaxID=1710537 RepID=UPI001B2FF734|nr:DNA adenine methylase [Halorussus halobius]